MKKISPPTLYKIFLVVMVSTLLLPLSKQILFPYNLCGILPFVIGTYMAVQAKRQFKQTSTPMHQFTNPTQLHQNGFFKYTRNPMYLGIAIGLSGVGILTGYLFNLLFGILYIVLCDYLYIRHEEKKLIKKFGSKYKEYKAKTRRWI